MSSFFDASSLDLEISAEEQSNMMKSIQEIFELEEEQANEEEQMRDEDEEPPVDLEDQQKRTEKLKGVLSTLAQLWWSDSDHMDLAAEKLADGSRDRKLIFCRLCVYYPPFYILFVLTSESIYYAYPKRHFFLYPNYHSSASESSGMC